MIRIIFVLVLYCVTLSKETPTITGDAVVQRVIDETKFYGDISNEERSNAIIKMFGTIINQLHKGRSVFGVTLPEPFLVNIDTIDQQSEAANIRITLADLKVFGFSKLQIDKVTTFHENKTVFVEVSLPKIEAEGRYKMKGNILLLPLGGDGEVFIDLYDIWCYVMVTLGVAEKNRKIVVTIEVADMFFKAKNMNVQLTNLDARGDPTLEKAIHHFINNNPEFMMEQISPTLADGVKDIVGNFLSRIFENVPADRLYPEDTQRLKARLLNRNL